MRGHEWWRFSATHPAQKATSDMTHTNSPLSIEGRRRLVQRCRTRPIAHVAAEMGISRACASKGSTGVPSRRGWSA